MLNPEDVADLASGPPETAETWVLQGDAAARTGFSVSAIRKWRRMGLVAERKVAAGGDLPRVEVKLEDVLARAALQPQRRPLEPPAPEVVTAPSGTLIIGIEDLEALFERMVRAERRAEVAEAELQSMQDQARYTLGQMAELRRQLQGYAAPAAGRQPPPRPEQTPPPRPPARPTVVAALGSASEGAQVIRARTGTPRVRPAEAAPPSPPPIRPAVLRRPEPRPAPDTGPSEVERLADRLREVYARLDEYRREPTISPAQERQRQRELVEYDRALIALCAALGMPTELRPGAAVSVDARAALTRALARRGFDARGRSGPRP